MSVEQCREQRNARRFERYTTGGECGIDYGCSSQPVRLRLVHLQYNGGDLCLVRAEGTGRGV